MNFCPWFLLPIFGPPYQLKVITSLDIFNMIYFSTRNPFKFEVSYI